jgi:hypothetical protein
MQTAKKFLHCTSLGEESNGGFAVGEEAGKDVRVWSNFIAGFPRVAYTKKLLPQ